MIDMPTNHAYIRVTDMKNQTVLVDDLKYITDDVFSQISAYTISKDDLYVTIAGTIGSVGEIPDILDGMNLTENAVKISNISINKKYLCYVLSSEFVQKQFRYQTHQVTMAKLALERILDTLIPVSPLKEQKQITERIQEANEQIEHLNESTIQIGRLINKAKSKILDLAIRGQLVPQNPTDEPASVLLDRIRAEKEELIKQGKIKRDKKESVIFKGEDNSYYEKIGDTVTCINEEIPFDLPENWSWCRGFSCFSGMTTKKPDADFFDYIDIDSIDNKKHIVTSPKHLPSNEAPSRASRGLQYGSVVFSLVRPYLKNIAFINENLTDCIASTGFYVCNSNGSFFPPFMFYLMLSEYVINGLNEYMKGDNSPSISKENIETWLYPVPPFEEQKCIVGKISELLSHIATIEAGLN